jgi:hypothetical protein
MSQIRVEASAVVAAAPQQVYAVFADYRNGHPRILPRAYFSDLAVEQGGYGAGTVFRVKTRFLGVERAYRMAVSEPAPGRTLVETDLDTGLATTFTITATSQEQQARVQIATVWEASGGMAGLIERLTTPPIMRMIYREELRQLAAYLQQKLARAS